MNARLRAWTRGLGIAAATLVYAVLAHVSNLHPRAQALGVALALGPLLLAMLLLLWRGGGRIPALLLAGAAAAALARYWTLLAAHLSWLYLLQQAGFYGLLGAMFGRSLLHGSVPLCTHWATLVHGPLPPAMVRYTRQVTTAWTVFFALLTVAHVLLFQLAPLPVWSAFANFLCLPLVAAMFIGEYVVRGLRLPDIEHAGILTGVRAFLGSPGPDVARRG